MHYTAYKYGEIFFKRYAYRENLKIVEVGSQDVNGALRDHAPSGSKYIGLDFVKGKSVDIILEDSYHYPLPDNYADILVTSSCFEHSQFFWLTFMESLRVLKPDGVMYVSAPSNGYYHTYPTDNWRFYPDAAKALSAYANTQGMNTAVLESFIGKENYQPWRDFVAVFIKDVQYVNLYPDRIYNIVPQNLEPSNIWVYGKDEIINYQFDMTKESISINHGLYSAAITGNIEALRKHLSEGAEVNYYNGKATALYAASENNHSKIVEMLLDAGANPELKASNGITPLYYAAQENYVDIAILLLKAGANTETTFKISEEIFLTPLCVSASRGYANLVGALTEYGAHKNVSVNGKIPAQIAAENGHTDIAQFLLGDISGLDFIDGN